MAIETLYPFSTGDGKSIPLDIINPDGLIVQAISTTPATIGPVTGLDIATFIASKPCMLRFGAALPNPIIDGQVIEDCLIIPEGVVVTVQCPSTTMYVKALSESGTLYVQLVKRWAGLGLPKQYTKK